MIRELIDWFMRKYPRMSTKKEKEKVLRDKERYERYANTKEDKECNDKSNQ